MIRIFAFLTVLLFAAPAAAQDVPPTAEQIRAARTHADDIIKATGSEGLFANITTTDMPTVRHIPSGMTCEFVGHDDRDVIRFYGEPRRVRGDDVSCGTWIGRTYVTLFATRYQERPSREVLMSEAVRQLKAAWPAARPYDGEITTLTLPGQTEPLFAVFDVENDGQTSRSIILIQNAGEWSFKARATGPSTDDTAIEMGGMAFAIALPGGLDALKAAQAEAE